MCVQLLITQVYISFCLTSNVYYTGISSIWPVFNCVLLRSNLSFSVLVSVSAHDGIVALGKAHTRSTQSLSSLPKVAVETVPICVWLNTGRSRPLEGGLSAASFLHSSFLQAISALMLWPVHVRKFLKPLSTSALPNYRPDVISAVFTSLSPCSFPLTPACPGL